MHSEAKEKISTYAILVDSSPLEGGKIAKISGIFSIILNNSCESRRIVLSGAGTRVQKGQNPPRKIFLSISHRGEMSKSYKRHEENK